MTAATVYPGAIDTFETPGATLAGAPLHEDLHKHLSSAVRAIEVALGTNPDLAATDPTRCNGRLTFTSGLAVPTTDVVAAANVYWSPFGGDTISLFDGVSAWSAVTFAELTQSLAAMSSGNCYDVFAYNNAGTVALELLAWTNSTTRATALARQNGILVKSGATTRRYLGTVYASGAGTSEDSITKRYLWNNYNRRPHSMRAPEPTASWGMNSTTWRSANNSTACRLQFVVGFEEDAVTALAHTVAGVIDSGYAATIGCGIGLDSTTTLAAGAVGFGGGTGPVTNGKAGATARYDGYPGVGFHYLQQLENATPGNTSGVTFYGGTVAATNGQTSIHATVMA